jgi:hypothetical protein
MRVTIDKAAGLPLPTALRDRVGITDGEVEVRSVVVSTLSSGCL